MRRSLKESNFHFGMNTLDDPTTIPDGFARHMENLIPSVGSPIPRKGHAKFDGYKLHSNFTGNGFIIKINSKDYLLQETKDQFSVVNWYYSDSSYIARLEDYNGQAYIGPIYDTTVINNVTCISTSEGLKVIEKVDSDLRLRRTYLNSDTIVNWYVEEDSTAAEKNRPNTAPAVSQAGSLGYIDSIPKLGRTILKDNHVTWGYLITMVRRTDIGLNDTSTSYVPSDLESSSLSERDIRLFSILPYPLSDSLNTYSEVTSGGLGDTTKSFALDSKNEQLYSALVLSAGSQPVVNASEQTQYWTPMAFRKYSHIDKPASTVVLPGGAVTVSSGDTWTFDDQAGYIANLKVQNPEITHFRIYRTVAQDTFDGALGSEFFHLADVPLDSVSYNDTQSDAELSGSTGRYSFWGTQPTYVSGKFDYSFGRLWFTNDDNKSFCNYTQYPQELNADLKWIGHNRPDTNWFQVEPALINKVIRIADNLLIMTDRDIRYIPKGQPDISPPILISNSFGLKFEDSVVVVKNKLYFVSTLGPAVYQDGQVQLLESFRDAILYPNTGSSFVKRSSDYRLDDVENVESIVLNDLIINRISIANSNLVKWVCYIDEQSLGSIGAFRITSQDSFFDDAKIIKGDNRDGLVFCQLSKSVSLAKLMSSLDNKDFYNYVKVILKTKSQWVYPEVKDFEGEAFNLKLIQGGSDYNTPTIRVFSEEKEVASNESWYRHLQDGSFDESWHRVNMYNFQDGVIGTRYAFALEKIVNSDWYLHGFDLTFIPRKRKVPLSGRTAFSVLIPEGVDYDVIESLCKPLEVYEE